METPTIVRRTKDYMLIKVPLPKRDILPNRRGRNGKMTPAEKRLRMAIQEGERDVKAGRVITARSIDEALKKYAKRQWD